MSVARQLGLEEPHGGLLVSARDRWVGWQQEHPVLGVADDLADSRRL